MKEFFSTINSKGQITIPADVRRHLGVVTSDKVAFVMAEGGQVELRAARFTLGSVLGSIEALSGESVDLDREIAEAMEAAARRANRRPECP